MLSIKKTIENVTNKSLYQLTGQVSLGETIRERHLKFTGQFICMHTNEPTNRFVIYESKIRSYFRPGSPKKTSKSKFAARSTLWRESPRSQRNKIDGGEQIQVYHKCNFRISGIFLRLQSFHIKFRLFGKLVI